MLRWCGLVCVAGWVLLAATPAGVRAQDNSEQLSLSLFDLLGKLPEFSTLFNAIKKAKLAQRFKEEAGPFTVFAPTNAAFKKIDKEKFAAVISNEQTLVTVIEQHVLGGKIKAKEFPEGKSDLKTIGNQDIAIVNDSEDNVQLKVIGRTGQEATVVSSDIEAKNGIIHAVDTVIQ